MEGETIPGQEQVSDTAEQEEGSVATPETVKLTPAERLHRHAQRVVRELQELTRGLEGALNAFAKSISSEQVGEDLRDEKQALDAGLSERRELGTPPPGKTTAVRPPPPG